MYSGKYLSISTVETLSLIPTSPSCFWRRLASLVATGALEGMVITSSSFVPSLARTPSDPATQPAPSSSFLAASTSWPQLVALSW